MRLQAQPERHQPGFPPLRLISVFTLYTCLLFVHILSVLKYPVLEYSTNDTELKAELKLAWIQDSAVIFQDIVIFENLVNDVIDKT